MIDVLLTTLAVIATVAGALAVQWLIVSAIYALGCVAFGWDTPPRYIPPWR
jgi:hypothetical protein